MALDKHRRIVREMPVHIEKRMQNIAARNENLNARLERDRVTAHLQNMPSGLQSLTTRHHIGTLNQKIHHLANKGLNDK